MDCGGNAGNNQSRIGPTPKSRSHSRRSPRKPSSQASCQLRRAIAFFGSPSAAVAILRVEFGSVIARRTGPCHSQAIRLPALTAEQNKALVITPPDGLLALPMLPPRMEFNVTGIAGHSLRLRRERSTEAQGTKRKWINA